MTENFDEKFDKEWNELDKDYMDKEAWIASRTDNPDRLGEDSSTLKDTIKKETDKELCMVAQRKMLARKER